MSVQDEVFDRDPSLDERAFELQATFRTLLDCMARPGEVARLCPSADCAADAERVGLFPATLMLADMLLDSGTTFALAGESADAATRFVAVRTHAARAAVDTAAYVVLPEAVRDKVAAGTIAVLTPGTLEEPHRGATAIVECSVLLGADAAGVRVGSASNARDKSFWRLSGPGIDGASVFSCDRADVLGARAARMDEFPCGIDLIFVDGFGHIAAVPRSSSCEEVESWDM